VLDKCARDAGNIAEILNREMEIETYSEMKADWSQKPESTRTTSPACRRSRTRRSCRSSVHPGG